MVSFVCVPFLCVVCHRCARYIFDFFLCTTFALFSFICLYIPPCPSLSIFLSLTLSVSLSLSLAHYFSSSLSPSLSLPPAPSLSASFSLFFSLFSLCHSVCLSPFLSLPLSLLPSLSLFFSLPVSPFLLAGLALSPTVFVPLSLCLVNYINTGILCRIIFILTGFLFSIFVFYRTVGCLHFPSTAYNGHTCLYFCRKVLFLRRSALFTSFSHSLHTSRPSITLTVTFLPTHSLPPHFSLSLLLSLSLSALSPSFSTMMLVHFITDLIYSD